MKRFIILFSFVGLFSFASYAQCTPQQFGGGLTYPESEIAYAAATQFYEQIIHVRIPEDTTVPPVTIPITIDSAGITAINGLPTGFSYQTNSATDTWPGNSYGCVVIQGTPTVADVGTIPFTVDIVIYALGQSVPYTLDYELVVLDASHVGFENINEIGFALNQNTPNPSNGLTKVDFKTIEAQTFDFTIYNMQGQIIHQESIEAQSGLNTIQIITEDYPAGVYTYRLSNGNQIATKRMVIR